MPCSHLFLKTEIAWKRDCMGHAPQPSHPSEQPLLCLEDQGHVTASLTFIGPAVDAVASLQVAAVKQRTLCDYFSVQ